MARYKRTLQFLKQELGPNEEIVASVFGQYETTASGSSKSSNKEAVLAATDSRVIFYVYGFFSTKKESYPYSSISSIQETFGGITIFASPNKVQMKRIVRGNLALFIQCVQAKMGRKGEVAQQKLDIQDQIKKLAQLHDEGILSEEEFVTKKRELLGRL